MHIRKNKVQYCKLIGLRMKINKIIAEQRNLGRLRMKISKIKVISCNLLYY